MGGALRRRSRGRRGDRRKTARRTFKKARGEAAIHVVTAYAVERRLVLGQVKTEQKSNEITAIPTLWTRSRLRGDRDDRRHGCQREIARKINDKGAEYVLAVKGNQPPLIDNVRLFDAEQSAWGFAEATVDRTETVDGDHGRIETRAVTDYQNVEWLHERDEWPGLKSVIKVESRREIGAKVETEIRFYLASAVLTAIVAAPSCAPLGNWTLHWCSASSCATTPHRLLGEVRWKLYRGCDCGVIVRYKSERSDEIMTWPDLRGAEPIPDRPRYPHCGRGYIA